MFLSDAAQDAIRTAEITATNAAATPADSQAAFRTTEIVAQNQTAASSPLPRFLLAGAGLFLAYKFILKGMK